MSVINATIGAGTRRMLQDVLAWNHARGQDITRVQAMAASGLIPKDSAGNLQLPQDLLDGLWRPFPGSNSTVNVTNIGNGQPAADGGQGQGGAAAQPAAPQAVSPVASQPATQPPVVQPAPPVVAPVSTAPSAGGALSALGNVPTWLKVAAAASGIGGAGLLGAWLNSKPAQKLPQAAQEMMYELHLGTPQKPASGDANGQ